MRKSLIVLTLLAAIIFAVGYLIGQIRGVTAGSAAGSPPIQLWTGIRPHLDGNGPGGYAHGPHAGGKVTAVNGDTITVQPFADRDGQESQITTITLTSTTQYFSGPGQSATRGSIKVGTYVHAEGTVSSDGKTLTATQVFVSTSAPTAGMHGGPGAMGPHADGTVTAVNGDTVTVTADNDRSGSTEYTSVTTILLTSTTQYDAGWGQTGSKSDIKVGSYIIAQGAVSSNGKTLTATHVMVRPSGTGSTGNHLFHFRPFGRMSGPSV